MIDEETTARLLALDQKFYEAGARDFAEHRTHPWPGWSRILATPPGRVLDVGCGHGRFKEALGGQETGYLGIDRSEALLKVARAQHGEHFQQLDVLFDPLPAPGFDLVVAFGLLHHIPGRDRRLSLLRRLLPLGSRLVVTFWRFADRPRLQGKLRSWSELGLREEALEPGDHLLAFGEHRRYAHHFEDQEVEALIRDLGAQVLDDFCADGAEQDLNRYLTLTL
ncbi:MAG: class I SAM-dependent methyltransferase [Deltaproteobacteria bacterium]|jgi:tRNA (uracil-5-)-methyltransferase TRM9|nr:class I SAM-dependent methyltransferase [Deltaproteobacteria bacterium]